MNATLIENINYIKSQYKPAENLALRVSYYPYKNINHTIRIRERTIYIRLSDKIQNAPIEIQASVVRLLFDKLYRRSPDKTIRRNYLNYINQNIVPQLEKSTRRIASNYSAEGRFFNLDNIFECVNKEYFASAIKKPKLGWSQKKSTRRLAFYDHERDLIVISRIFDSRRTPNYVVEFLMFHEMLHIKIPVKSRQGRRIIHSKNFREEEKKFKEYEQVQKWLKRRLWKLSF